MAAAISPVPQPKSRMPAGGRHSPASRAANCSTRELSVPREPYLLRQPRALWLNRVRTASEGGRRKAEGSRQLAVGNARWFKSNSCRGRAEVLFLPVSLFKEACPYLFSGSPSDGTGWNPRLGFE